MFEDEVFEIEDSGNVFTEDKVFMNIPNVGMMRVQAMDDTEGDGDA